MAIPIIESVHEAAGSYQVGTGLFLMRFKRRLLTQLIEAWLTDENHARLAELVALTRRDIDVTAEFLGEDVEIPREDERFRISETKHAAELEHQLLQRLDQDGGPPEAITAAFGDTTPPRAIALTMASVRNRQLRSYLAELRYRLELLDEFVRTPHGGDWDNSVQSKRNDRLRNFLDYLISPFFFLSWVHNGANWLTTWIPPATLHHRLFTTSEKGSRIDGVVLYPSLASIPADAEENEDLSQQLPLLRDMSEGRGTPLGLVQEMHGPTRSVVRWKPHLISRPTAAIVSDLHFLNVSTLFVALKDETGERDPMHAMDGVLHICTALNRSPPFWLAPEAPPCDPARPSEVVKERAAARLLEIWSTLGGDAFVEEMRRGLGYLLYTPSRKIIREVRAVQDARVQSHVTTTHVIKGMANELLDLVGSAHTTLDRIDEARTLPEALAVADLARERLQFVHTEIALIAGVSQYAHDLSKRAQDRPFDDFLPPNEPERVVEGVLHLYLLFLRERLRFDRNNPGKAELRFTAEAQSQQAAALAAIRQEVGDMGLADDWRELLGNAVHHSTCRPIFVGLSETIRNIRPVRSADVNAVADITVCIRRIDGMPGARLSYLLSQYQDGLDAEAIRALDDDTLRDGLRMQNRQFGRTGFRILETQLAPEALLSELGLERSDPDGGKLRYHLLLQFGTEQNNETDTDE